MQTRYTDEENVQILISLMHHHGIRRVVASPGTTNVTFVASVQQDPYFEVYSAPDERSGAYMACGLAAETGEPVALSCTGATASRNYLSGLTEAFYRKLPVLAITSSQHLGRIGQHVAQVTDRTAPPPDTCLMSVQAPSIASTEDRWACETTLNEALLELRHRGGGPVHVNLVTTYSKGFGVENLPAVRAIDRLVPGDELPLLDGKRVAVFVGSHAVWDDCLIQAANEFCRAYGAAIFCDHTSNYRGPYRALGALVSSQASYKPRCLKVDILVHIGEVSGAHFRFDCSEVWRVSPDGKPRGVYRKLTHVFEMNERRFFEEYAGMSNDANGQTSIADEWQAEDERIREKMPELPFSNPWIAQQTARKLPEGSVLHLGILNSLRSWDLFETPNSVACYSNTGGFGIDGCVSSLIGASLANREKLYLGVVGDLAFFYDMNSLGNRHVGSNIRLIVVNNGVGTEFKNFNHPAARFGDDADAFMAARGHYGSKSTELLQHYAQDLGFEYRSAKSKEEYLDAMARFVDPNSHDQPLVLEVFTDSKDESDALEAIYGIEADATTTAKQAAKRILGDKGVRAVKKVLGR